MGRGLGKGGRRRSSLGQSRPGTMLGTREHRLLAASCHWMAPGTWAGTVSGMAWGAPDRGARCMHAGRHASCGRTTGEHGWWHQQQGPQEREGPAQRVGHPHAEEGWEAQARTLYLETLACAVTQDMTASVPGLACILVPAWSSSYRAGRSGASQGSSPGLRTNGSAGEGRPSVLPAFIPGTPVQRMGPTCLPAGVP